MLCRYCLNWPRCRPAAALDLGDPLVDLRLGRLHAERLGILDLQALVDHLPQELRRQPLLQVG